MKVSLKTICQMTTGLIFVQGVLQKLTEKHLQNCSLQKQVWIEYEDSCRDIQNTSILSIQIEKGRLKPDNRLSLPNKLKNLLINFFFLRPRASRKGNGATTSWNQNLEKQLWIRHEGFAKEILSRTKRGIRIWQLTGTTHQNVER